MSRAFGDRELKGDGLASLLRRGVEDGFWTTAFTEGVHFTADPVSVEPDVTELPRQPEDEVVLVATDGLWDVVSSSEAVAFARKGLHRGQEPQAVAESLAKLAVKRYSSDNVAVVVVDLKGAEGWGGATGTSGAQRSEKKKMFGFF